MRSYLRLIGISLVAVGLAILFFILFLRFAGPRKILSPVPQEAPIQGQELAPQMDSK